MTLNEYSDTGIVVHDYPELIQISECEFRRVWQIKLREKVPTTASDLVSLSSKLSFYGHEVKLEVSIDQQTLSVTVFTKFAITDYLFLNDCNLFAEIDHLVGEIEEIQGQPRNLWYPWFSQDSAEKLKLKRYIMCEVQVGLRYNVQHEFNPFGDLEVNDLIEGGAKVISIHPGGIITKQSDISGEARTLEVTGFFNLVRLVKSEPSLAENWLKLSRI